MIPDVVSARRRATDDLRVSATWDSAGLGRAQPTSMDHPRPGFASAAVPDRGRDSARAASPTSLDEAPLQDAVSGSCLLREFAV